MSNDVHPVRIADRLYEWRWWLSALLVGVYVFMLGGSRATPGPLTWVVFGLLAGLVWIPALMRWGRAGRRARHAFRQGLSGQDHR